jgi:hypothetical protein
VSREWNIRRRILRHIASIRGPPGPSSSPCPRSPAIPSRLPKQGQGEYYGYDENENAVGDIVPRFVCETEAKVAVHETERDYEGPGEAVDAAEGRGALGAGVDAVVDEAEG